jgi:hypothetical protein
MRRHLLLLLVCCGSILAYGQTPPAGLDTLSWLAGCWEATANGRTVTEQWMKPLGDMMLGMSRTVRQNRTVEHEFVRLERDSAGAIRYLVRPSGQADASFTLVRLGPGYAVFEDPAHDFPRRILYQRVPPDSLRARIEGEINGTPRAVDFPYRRISCN